MNLKEAYKTMQKEWVRLNRVKTGTKVSCLRHFVENELGFGFGKSEYPGKEKFIDDHAVGIVSGIEQLGIEVQCGNDYKGRWTFPFFTIEIIEPAKHTICFDDGKPVTISDESFQNLKKALNEGEKE